jgi:hypothetical protein
MSTDKSYTVYAGYKKGVPVYIGTTIQKPEDRFRKHKSEGKRLKISVLFTCPDAETMLQEEFRLIQEHNPPLNKIKHRPQNLTLRLTTEQLQARVGLEEWCQCCLKRRKRPGYKNCSHCKT